MNIVKRIVIAVLANLYNGPTRGLSVGLLIYLILWFAPFLTHDLSEDATPYVWVALGWRPELATALLIIPLGVIQAFFNPRPWYSGKVCVLGATVLSAFVIYTTLAPAYIMFVMEGRVPDYVPGNLTVVLMSLIIVTREVGNV